MNLSIKQYASTLAACAAFLCAAGAAQANPQPHGPQFSDKVTSSIDPKTGDVKVCFSEAGLKNKAVTYLAKANVTASYACRNKGGNCPPGLNTVITQTVSVSATYAPDKYGTVSACITLKVPTPKDNVCPGKMTLVLESVSWSGISITDLTNNIGPVAANPSQQSVNYGSCPAPH